MDKAASAFIMTQHHAPDPVTGLFVGVVIIGALCLLFGFGAWIADYVIAPWLARREQERRDRMLEEFRRQMDADYDEAGTHG